MVYTDHIGLKIRNKIKKGKSILANNGKRSQPEMIYVKTKKWKHYTTTAH